MDGRRALGCEVAESKPKDRENGSVEVSVTSIMKATPSSLVSRYRRPTMLAALGVSLHPSSDR